VEPTFQLLLFKAAATDTGGLIETGPLVTAVLLAAPFVATREKVYEAPEVNPDTSHEF
jgi:hypothetical protein